MVYGPSSRPKAACGPRSVVRGRGPQDRIKYPTGGKGSISDCRFRIEKTQNAERGAQEKDRFVFPLFPAMDRSYVSYMVWVSSGT